MPAAIGQVILAPDQPARHSLQALRRAAAISRLGRWRHDADRPARCEARLSPSGRVLSLREQADSRPRRQPSFTLNRSCNIWKMAVGLAILPSLIDVSGVIRDGSDPMDAGVARGGRGGGGPGGVSSPWRRAAESSGRDIESDPSAAIVRLNAEAANG